MVEQQKLLQQQQQQQLFVGDTTMGNAALKWNPNGFSSVPNTQQAMPENGLGSETFEMFEGASTELEIGYGQMTGSKVTMLSKPLTFQTSKVSSNVTHMSDYIIQN